MIQVRTKLLAAIAKWSSSDDGRPHLQQVCFGNRRMAACDGHRLVIAPFEEDVPAFTLHRNDIAAIAAAQRKLPRFMHSDGIRIEVAGNRATIGLDKDDIRTMTVKVDSTDRFPDIDAVVPTKKEGPEPPALCFQPRYLVAIEDVLKATDDTWEPGVRVEGWSALTPEGIPGPVLFESMTGIRFVIMPVRDRRYQ